MSSTSHALGPNEPPAPPNWVMGQPYRRRSGLVGSPGSVCPAHDLSGRPPPHRAARHRHRHRAPPTVVFVHGSLDRGDSFRLVMRRLPELATVAYDRRGYQGSRGGGVVDLGGHVAGPAGPGRGGARRGGPARWSPSGHSLGGDVVVGAALAAPRAFDAIGAFEPPMPWLGFRRRPGGEARAWPPVADDPGEEAERFFSRMVSPEAWARLTEEGRADAPCRRSGPGGRPAQRACREPALRRRRRSACLASSAWVGRAVAAAPPRAACEWLGEQRPRRGRLRDRGGAARGAPVAPGSLRRLTRLVVERAGS